jgi:hypothetical protein
MKKEVLHFELMSNAVDRHKQLMSEFMDGRNGLGSFSTNLYTAIKLADTDNLYKLAKGFPHEILSYLLWFHGEKYDYFREYYKLDFTVKRETKFIHVDSVNIENLRRNISKTWNEMVDNKSEYAIAEFLVNGSEGVYMLQRFGEMFEIPKLQRDPYQTEGYWDDWTYQISPQVDKDIEVILKEQNISFLYPESLHFSIDFTEGGSDLALVMILPEGFWEDKENGEDEDEQINTEWANDRN